ncbi:MAG: RNA-binding transcriptional accessory protein [Bacteroidales bacterium]|nr:RNA-binding transcriptional accessory protein [Bacteroidales bacterium]MBQ2525281.1 RNA-binding transcriptional accessory protein [Bacteroidales bacterium]
MKEIYIKFISEKLSVRDWQVENCVDLFAEGNTIPFISRYRKEKTGGLDDVEVAEIKHWTDVFEEMEKRKTSILGVIAEQGKLTDSLKKQIEDCVVAGELEDLYLPYRPKRRTRATAAKEAGLEPLADKMYDVAVADPRSEARKYVKGDVKDVDAALSGARDIIAERLSETASVRETLRGIFRTRRIVSKATKAGKETPEGQKYKGYFDYSEPLARIAPHRLLAILRGQDEGFLTVKIDADPEKCGNKLYYDFCHERRYPSQALAAEIREAVDDSYSRLLAPSITNEILKEFKEKADIESIKVFGENLRQLLLAPPVGQKRTMAIDPGFRNGCKIVCLDAQGNLLHHEIVYPHPPQNEKVKAITSVSRMVQEYDIQAIAIGNGTASRETEDFIKRIPLPEGCKVYVVSEDGASIYSASEVAREEFPDEDVTVRGAVSIGRRLMDPLAELVKIDPKSLGVGQYQYDVDQNLLKEKLDNTVIICVNTVGVNLNTASSYLLSYVSGIGPALASSIVKYRAASGGFESRADLMSVPRLGAKAFEQCAGFLRITNAANPLDNSAVHPECYHIVDKMAADLGVSTKELVRNEKLISQIKPEKYVEGEFGLPTINDILKELAKPGLDPREAAQEFSFADDVHEIEDLVAGMELPGIVTNITAFGAFVDIGVHENGLIHVSQMKAAGVKGPVDPSKILKLHQHVKVSVLQVDLDRKRISLRLLK